MLGKQLCGATKIAVASLTGRVLKKLRSTTTFEGNTLQT
jgi:hypothetical protein